MENLCTSLQEAANLRFMEDLKEFRGGEDKPFDQVWGYQLKHMGFTQIPNLLIAHPGLTYHEKMVLIAVISCGEACYAKTKTLAGRLGISDRRVRQILDSLIEKAWLSRNYENINQHGEIKKIRVLDWSLTRARLISLMNTPEELLPILTKCKLNFRKFPVARR